MIKNVIYPTDFSRASELGIKALEEMKKIGVEKVYVLHVIDLNRLIGPVSGIDIPAVINDYEVETERNTEIFSESIRKLGFDVHAIEPRTGEPSIVISETAEEVEADMIVIPSHGKSFISGLLLGSVSEGVVKRSRKPVLVVKMLPSENSESKSTFGQMFKRIVAGFDFSQSSEKMMDYVKLFAKKGEAERVTVVHVLERRDELNDEKLGKLEEIKCSFEGEGIDAEILVEKGTPYKEILRTSEERDATMITVSSGGEGFIRTILGGTADGIVRRSRVPVFVYKEQA